MSWPMWKRASIASAVLIVIAVGAFVIPLSFTSPAVEAQTLFDEAMALEKAGKNGEALAHLNDAIARDPKLQSARFELGLLSLRMGNAPSAVVELESVRAKGFNEDKIVLPLMRAYLMNGDYQNAIKKVDATKYSGNMQAAVLALQARAQIGLYNIDAARTLTTQALAQAPTLYLPLISAAMVARIDHKFSESEQYIDQGLAADPENLELTVLKAEARTLAADYNSAASLLDTITEKYPNNARAHVARAFVNIVRNTPDAIPRDLNAINSKAQVSKYLRAYVLFRTEKYADAVSLLNTIPAFIDQYPPAQYLLAAAALGNNQIETAISNAKKYARKVPDDPAGSELLAATALRKADGARAMALQELVQGKADILEYHRFVGGELWDADS